MRTMFGQGNKLSLLLLGALSTVALAGDVLSTNGYSTCSTNPTIQVNALNIQYDRSSNLVVFDVSGTSDKVQNVTAALTITAYGREVYSNTFKPCDAATYVAHLCPGK